MLQCYITCNLLHMNRPNYTESAIFISVMYSFLPEVPPSKFILPSPQLMLRHAVAVKSHPTALVVLLFHVNGKQLWSCQDSQ